MNRAGSELNGDIRKMCLEANGTYTDESTAIAPTSCTSTEINYPSSGNLYYEFYVGDYLDAGQGNYGEDGHADTATGAIAQAPGEPNIIVGMIDATDIYQPGSIGLYSNTTGDKIGTQAVIDAHEVEVGGEQEPYGSKAGGMGDVEILCDPAPIEIGNYVWMDVNKNGIQDPNEPPLADVNITLNCAGADIGIATTDTKGHYYFGGIHNTNLSPNETIKAEVKCRLIMAQADVNGKPPTANPNNDQNDTIDNDAVADGTDNVIDFNTTASNNHSLDFGIHPTLGCVTGVLFEDKDGDDTLSAGDIKAPAQIKLTLTDIYGNLYIAYTDANGSYSFAPVIAGDVNLSIDTTDTDIPTDANWSNPPGTTALFVLVESNASGTPNPCEIKDFYYTIPTNVASICGNVSEDTDNDNIGDKIMSGVTLNLYADSDNNGVADGSILDTVDTNSTGDYCFEGLGKGDYVVVEIQPNGYVDVSENEGGADNDKPDNNITNSIASHVDAGEIDSGNDFVEEDASKAYRLGDLFWIDANSDGIYDAGEKKVSGAKIELLDINGTVITTTTTDSNGRYHFDVPAGEYKVRFHIPQNLLDDGFVFVSAQGSTDETNKVSGDGVVEIAIVVGPNFAVENMTLDAAIECPCTGMTSDSGDAMGSISMLGMILLTIVSALLFVRRDDDIQILDGDK